MRARLALLAAVALIAALWPDAVATTTPPTGRTAGSAEPVKVAMHHQVPGGVLHRDGRRAPRRTPPRRPASRSVLLPCKTPADVACQTAQIEDAVTKGFKAIVITPMGPEVIPAMQAAAKQGVKVVLADNNLDEFTEKTAVAATDNVKGGEAAGEYLKTRLKAGDTIGLMEGVRGVPALDARIDGVKEALEGTGVKVIIGGARPSATPPRAPPSRRTC